MEQEKCRLAAGPQDCQRCASMVQALLEQGDMDEADAQWVRHIQQKLQRNEALYQNEVDRLDELWTDYGMGERE